MSLVHVGVWSHQSSFGRGGSRSPCLVHSRVQMAAVTLFQLNHTNRAIITGFTIIKPNLPSVNTHLDCDPHTQVCEQKVLIYATRHIWSFDPFISSKLWATTHWCNERQMYVCITSYIMRPIFFNPAALFSGRESGRLCGAELCPDGCSHRPPARLTDESNHWSSQCSNQTRSDGERRENGTGMIRWDDPDFTLNIKWQANMVPQLFIEPNFTITFPSLLWMKSLFEREREKFRAALDFVHWELIGNVVVVCSCCDLIWVTNCPALVTVNTSSEKTCRCKWEGKLFWLNTRTDQFKK